MIRGRSDRYSRREFIRRHSIAGAGALLALHAPGILRAESGANSNRADDRLYFDALARIGPRHHKHPAERWSLDHLIAELEHCSISGALVSSTQSLLYDAMHANLELSRQLDGHRRLFAAWNVLPHASGEFPPPDRFLEQMRRHDVRAVTLFPETNRWDWRNEASRDLLSLLSRERILTIVSAPELGGWSGLDQFLTRWPELPVLLSGANWSDQRYVLPLMKQHGRLHLTFERFQINEGLEYFVGEGLADRLLFGTNAPTMAAGPHRTYIDYAAVPEEAARKIAGGNLARLLRGQQPPSVYLNPNEDRIMRAARNGRPLPCPVLDMHMHILDEGLQGAGGHYRMLNGGPAGVFSLIERFGNSGGGIMSWNGVVSSDMKAGFETVRNALDAAPRGYWGLATIDPVHFSQRELERIIPQVYSDRRIIGMKPYHFYGVEYHDPLYDLWWEYGSERRLYALIHRSRNDGVEVETLAERYPNVRWVIAHAGGSFEWADIAIAAMRKFPNVYAELTFTSVPGGVIEYIAEQTGGDDRIVYGSDLPMRDPRQQLGWVLFCRLPESSKRKILAENAYDVIRPCLDRLPARSRPRMQNPAD